MKVFRGLSGCGPGGGGDIDEAFEEMVEGAVSLVDGDSFFVSERDAHKHALSGPRSRDDMARTRLRRPGRAYTVGRIECQSVAG